MVEINSTRSKVKKIRDKKITGELGMKKATKVTKNNSKKQGTNKNEDWRTEMHGRDDCF